MKSINKAVEISAHTMRNVLKRNSLRFATALLVALASFVAVPNATFAAGPQHHDQVPGFYRLKVGDLEVGYTPEEVDVVLVTHLHSDHIGGLTTQDGKIVFPNAEIDVAKADSDFWLSPEIAAKAPKDAQPFFQSAQAIAAPYIKAGKWHTFSGSEPIVDGMQVVPLPGHTPGHTGYEFSSKGQKILFWGDIVHAQRVQLQHPEVTGIFDIDQTAAAATRQQLLSKLV